MNQKLLSPVELVKLSWALFTGHYKTFLTISFLLTLVSLAPSLAIMLSKGNADAPITPWAGVGILVGVIVLIFLSLWGELAILKAALSPEESVGNLFSSTVDKVGALLIIGFMTGLIIVLGVILLIVPGIIFAVWYAFASVVLLDEGLRGWNALKRSKELVKGYWGQVFVRWIALVIIAVVLYLPGVIIFKQYETANFISSSIISFLVGPIFAIYEVMLYKNLKEVKAPPIVYEPQA